MNILYFCQKVWLIDELNTFEHFFNKYELHNKSKNYINFIDFVISSFTFLILTLLHDWGENIVSSGGSTKLWSAGIIMTQLYLLKGP